MKLSARMVIALFAALSAQAQLYDETQMGTYIKDFTWDASAGSMSIQLDGQSMPFRREKIIGMWVTMKNDQGTRVHSLGRLAETIHGEYCSYSQDYSGGMNFEVIHWDSAATWWPGINASLHDLPDETGWLDHLNYFDHTQINDYNDDQVPRGYLVIEYLTN
jgi:hypothetical protein